MAVGLGYLFGIRIPQNFASPYQAVSPQSFWARSRYLPFPPALEGLRLHIPLGPENREGRGRARYRNLMFTMLIGGLWHGAGLNVLFSARRDTTASC